jgi:cytochrome P450
MPDTEVTNLLEPPFAGAPALDLDPFEEPFVTDPYPHYEQLRAAGPVVWLPRYGCWALTRYNVIRGVLNDWKIFSSAAGAGLANFNNEKPFRPKSLLLEADPPAHSRARAVLAKAISPRVMARLEPVFEAEAVRTVDALIAKGTFDGAAELAEAFPLKVFPDAVGLAPEGRENLMGYGNMVFNLFGPRNRIFRDSARRAGKLSAWVAKNCTRAALGPGGFGEIVYQAADAGTVTEEEAGLLVRSLLSAGIDTTVGGIANALLCFARFPEQWDLLHADPSRAANAFEETLRYEAPVLSIFRTTTCDTEIAGTPVAGNTKVLALIGSGNRDPDVWENADRFDIARQTVGHLAWGSGIHRCVGMSVAKTEGEIVLRVLAERVKRIELAGKPVRRPNNTLRLLETLPLKVIAA